MSAISQETDSWHCCSSVRFNGFKFQICYLKGVIACAIQAQKYIDCAIQAPNKRNDHLLWWIIVTTCRHAIFALFARFLSLLHLTLSFFVVWVERLQLLSWLSCNCRGRQSTRDSLSPAQSPLLWVKHVPFTPAFRPSWPWEKPLLYAVSQQTLALHYKYPNKGFTITLHYYHLVLNE